MYLIDTNHQILHVIGPQHGMLLVEGEAGDLHEVCPKKAQPAPHGQYGYCLHCGHPMLRSGHNLNILVCSAFCEYERSE